MQITPSGLDAIYYNFLARFQAGFARTDIWTPSISTEVPSTSRENRYPWMKQLPRMKEWIGERQVENLSARIYTLPNKSWEETVEVDREDIEDDNFGVFAPMLEEMGYQGRKWPDDVMKDVLQDGVTNLAYDGQPFFDANHPVDVDDSAKGVYSNNHTGTALTPTNYASIRAGAMSILGSDGRPLKVNPTLLVVPPALEKTGREILQSTVIGVVYGSNTAAAGVTNVMAGTANLLVIPELAGEDTTWYLLDVTKPIRPFIWQLRKAPVFVSLTGPMDANVFWRKKFIYGADCRGNGGYTLPFLAHRCIA